MARDVRMVMYGGWGLKMFLKPFFKISCWLSNILFHQNPPCHICIYIWLHFSWGVDLYPWESWGGLWWYDLLWDVLQSHTSCKFSCSFHSALDGKVPQCKALELWCYLALDCCCCLAFSLGLRTGSSTWLCWVPSLDICISLGIGINVFLLPATGQGLSILFLPCDTGCLSHCTLMLWHDSYPNVNTGLCELASYRSWCSVCYLHLQWSACPESQVTSELQSLTLWYLTIKGWVKATREFARSMGLKYISKEVIPSKTSSWLPRIKIHSSRKVESYIDTNVTGWILMKSILESQQEILKRGLRNILRPHPPYMTILTPLAMLPLLTIFPYWGERTKASWEPYRRPYT